jgi:hypothetical protein
MNPENPLHHWAPWVLFLYLDFKSTQKVAVNIREPNQLSVDESPVEYHNVGASPTKGPDQAIATRPRQACLSGGGVSGT